MRSEFNLSIVNHAVASGRDANCFFQSFIHTLTNQESSILEAIQTKYPDSIKAFVDTFNNQLNLNPTIDFTKIIEISRSLHPLERETVFGPILRHTYNTMIDRNLLQGSKLKHHPDAIVFQPQTIAFANAFGSEIKAYMSEEQLELSIKDGMPQDIAVRIKLTGFEINDRVFYCDNAPQSFQNGKLFDLNLVYADKHLNYTLGSSQKNNEQLSQVTTKRTDTKDGIFAIGPASGTNAPLAEHLTFGEIVTGLCKRFSLNSDAFKIDCDTERINTLREQLNISAVSIVSFDLSGITDCKSFGFADENKTTSVEKDTVFSAASLSKPVFAYLVLKLIQKGLLSKSGCSPESGLDRPLYELADFGLPEFRNHPYYKLITPRMILSHTTGLHSFGDEALQTSFEPGKEFYYSGVPFTYLQEVIQHITGKDLEQLAKEIVFDPIGMNKSTFVPKSPLKLHPANSLSTTGNDYARFVSHVLNDETLAFAFENKQSLPDQWGIGQGLSNEDHKKIAWGLIFGLQKNEQGEVNAAFHSGDMNNNRAFVAIDLKNKKGIVFFANSKDGLMLADDIISRNVSLDAGLNYIFKKYGFTRKPEPGWQKKEKDGVYRIIACYEVDKNKLVEAKFIDNNVGLRTLFVQHFIASTAIYNEFEKFKEKNQLEENVHYQIDMKKDKEGNIESVKINIFGKHYEQFIETLETERLLPLKAPSIENKISNTFLFELKRK